MQVLQIHKEQPQKVRAKGIESLQLSWIWLEILLKSIQICDSCKDSMGLIGWES